MNLASPTALRRLVLPAAVLGVLACAPTAQAAWTGPGRCEIPSGERPPVSDDARYADPSRIGRIRTSKVPCSEAVRAIYDMYEETSAFGMRSRFRFRADGPGWAYRYRCVRAGAKRLEGGRDADLKLSCTTRGSAAERYGGRAFTGRVVAHVIVG